LTGATLGGMSIEATAGASPGSLESLRGRNRERVVAAVQRRGATSRADIARDTGLSRSTVSSLVGALISDGLLVERPDRSSQAAQSSTGGRPVTALTLNPRRGAVLGVHFGHDTARVAVADLSGSIVAERVRDLDVDHHVQATLDFVAEGARALLRQSGLDAAQVLGCGVAVSSPVHRSPGAFGDSLLTDWRGVDIAGELGRRLGTPVLVGNDANLGAVAEWTFGAGRGVDDLIYVMASDGLGAGLILGGQLYAGGQNIAGEFGHVVVVPGGQVCRCGGRGCLETVAGGPAVAAALEQVHGRRLSLADAVSLAAAGDVGAGRVFSDCGRAIGEALAGICAVLDPSLVVLGGKATAAGPMLVEGVREALARRLPPAIIAELPVLVAQLGARAEVLGAIASVTRNAPAATLELLA
jgi:predicted NBD/HSP70 family sugar kinase